MHRADKVNCYEVRGSILIGLSRGIVVSSVGVGVGEDGVVGLARSRVAAAVSQFRSP
jgi:hypothetical protein